MTQVSISNVAEEWRKQRGQSAPENFLEAYYPRFETGAHDPEAYAAAAARHFALGTEYDGQKPAIAIYNPSVDSPEFRDNHTVIAIVLADMPHLVSSIVSDLAANGRAIRRVHHPIITVTGTGQGEKILSPAEAPALSADTASIPTVSEASADSADGAPQQSWIRLEITASPATSTLESACAGLDYAGAAARDAQAMAAAQRHRRRTERTCTASGTGL